MNLNVYKTIICYNSISKRIEQMENYFIAIRWTHIDRLIDNRYRDMYTYVCVCVCEHTCVCGSGCLQDTGRALFASVLSPGGGGSRCSRSCFSDGAGPAGPSPAGPGLPTGNSATCWESGARTQAFRGGGQNEGQTTEARRPGDKGRVQHPVLGFRAVSGHSPGPGGGLASLRPQGTGVH